MTDEPDTTLDHFDLVDLTVDGKLVEFSSALVTQETTWVGSGERQHTVRHWYGEIVSADLGLDPAASIPSWVEAMLTSCEASFVSAAPTSQVWISMAAEP